MFLGTHQARTDAKSRLSVPAAFRRSLEGHGETRVVLAPSLTNPAIHCFPLPVWHARMQRLANLAQSDPLVDHVKKFQVAMASDCEPDGHGRILVGAELREFAALDVPADVAVVGQGQTFDLWAAAAWQSAQAEARSALRGQAARLAELGL